MSVKAAQRTESEAMIARLLVAVDETTVRDLIAQHGSVDWDAIVSTLTERARQEINVNTARAQQLADIAICVAEATGSKIAAAKSRRAKANALYATDQHAAAIEMHCSAAAIFESLGERQELARTLSSSLQPLLLLGRYDEALTAGERARAIFSEQGNEWRLARLEINIGNVYQRQDRFAEALQHYKSAYTDLVTRDDAEGLAAVLSNLALCHIFLNDFPSALEFHRKARQHCAEKGMSILVAYADYNIGYLYFLRGEYGRAIKMLREAAAGAKKVGDAYQLALCDLDLSEMYIELNLNTEAGEFAHKACEAFQQLGFGYEGAKALVFAAIGASRQGQAFEAVKLFTQAREMFVRDKNLVWPSLIDLYKALVLFNEGRLFEARQLCAGAREFFSAAQLPRKAVFAQLLLARILTRMNDRSSAREHCALALEQLTGLDAPTLLYDAEFLVGDIEHRDGHQDLAYEAYLRARAVLEGLRGNLRGEELKIAFFSNKQEVYERLVDLCLSRPNALEEVFAYIEQAKSRSLMELLTQPVHTVSETDTGQSELVRSIRNLREELNWYYNLIEREQLRPEENSPARIQNLERQAKSRETELLRSLQEATDIEIHQAGLQRSPANKSVEEIRSTLGDEAVLIEYFCVEDRVLACVLGRKGFQIVPVTLQSRVQKHLQFLQFQLSKFRLDPQYVNKFRMSLLESTQAHFKDLYQELLAPLRTSVNAAHLVFVPHGLLHYVPFHALHDGNKNLIDEFSISYAPSASIFAMCQENLANTSGESLIMGIADAQAHSILDEVRSLQAILPNAQLFLGDKATHSVLAEHGPRSHIIHIATHGYFRQDNPMFSSIRLGDSYLNLYDLHHLKLPAELVVLSGCATGVNVIRTGDEQIGLVRGLLQAGAQSMVLTLWDVHDASTKEFMTAFYTGWQRSLSKSMAFKAAMVELREHYPHPYYWAPFLLIGKG
jgi:CHAT domain-containing protein